MNIFTQLILGPLMVVLALIFKFYPPKKINDLYGYRTKRSKKSQEVWDEANRYNPNLILMVAIITTIVQGILFLTSGAKVATAAAAAVLVVLLLATIPITESHLKKNFDENGKPRDT